MSAILILTAFLAGPYALMAHLDRQKARAPHIQRNLPDEPQISRGKGRPIIL